MNSQTPSAWTDEVNDLLSDNGKVSADDINQKVQQAQSALLELKRQQDEIERQKKELEDLSRKQREFEEGRRDIFEKLTRGLVVLERQEFEVRREVEQIQLIRESFTEQLTQMEELNPQEWSPKDLQSELTRALAIIDQAQAVHGQARTRLDVLRDEPEFDGNLDEIDEVESKKSFLTTVRDGFAFTLPLMFFIAVIILISSLRH